MSEVLCEMTPSSPSSCSDVFYGKFRRLRLAMTSSQSSSGIVNFIFSQTSSSSGNPRLRHRLPLASPFCELNRFDINSNKLYMDIYYSLEDGESLSLKLGDYETIEF